MAGRRTGRALLLLLRTGGWAGVLAGAGCGSRRVRLLLEAVEVRASRRVQRVEVQGAARRSPGEVVGDVRRARAGMGSGRPEEDMAAPGCNRRHCTRSRRPEEEEELPIDLAGVVLWWR